MTTPINEEECNVMWMWSLSWHFTNTMMLQVLLQQRSCALRLTFIST